MKNFKVWDTTKKKWFQEGEIAICNNGEVLRFDEDGSFTHLGSDLYVIVFSTGQKDKDGKEIYGGDILEMEDGSRNPYTVIWSFQFQGWGLDGTPGGLQVWLSEYTEDCKVIGNIYQNPELPN